MSYKRASELEVVVYIKLALLVKDISRQDIEY
jgi:hypothetical protein